MCSKLNNNRAPWRPARCGGRSGVPRAKVGGSPVGSTVGGWCHARENKRTHDTVEDVDRRVTGEVVWVGGS